MKHYLFSLYELLILRRPLLSLIVLAVVVGWLASFIPQFKLDASADSLVLEGDDDLKYYRQVSQNYQSEEFLFITYRSEQDLLSEQVLGRITALRDDLDALPEVSSVTSILDVPLLASPPVTLEQIAAGEAINNLRTQGIDKAQAREEFKTSPIYKDLLMNPEGNTTALQVNLVRDQRYLELLEAREAMRELSYQGPLNKQQQKQLEKAEYEFRQYAVQYNEQQSRLVDTVRAVIDKHREGAELFLGGVPMIAADMISFVKSDLVVFGSGIIIFIIVTMALIFRRLTWVFISLSTCLLTATFMLGLLTWLDWRMTVISSNFVALLLIITLSITIHLVVRYREMLTTAPELSQRELARRTALLMAKPCVYTALTTIVAFASLVISGIRPVIDFGWMMTLGVLAALCMVFTIVPTVLMLVKKPAMTATGSASVAMTLRFATLTEKLGNWILFAALAIAALAIYGVSQLQVENRFIDYFDEDTEIYQGMEVIDAELGGTIPLEIIINPDPVEQDLETVAVAEQGNSVEVDEPIDTDLDEEFADTFDEEFGSDFEDDFGDEPAQTSYWFNRSGLARIEEVHDYIDSLDETGKVLSAATLYKTLRQLTGSLDDIQLALVQKAMPKDIGEIMLDPYLKEELDQARITVRVMETSRSLRRDELLKEIKTHLVDELGFDDEQVRLTGMLVLYNNMLQSLYSSQILTLGAVFVAIVIMFTVLFRSISLALIAIAPNVLAAGIVLGGMGLAGIPLDIMTVTIAAITIGIGVDDTIHYVHRFTVEFPKDRNYMAAMYRCHGSIGKAMYYTSIIIIVGFSILALSNFTPSIYFGLLTGTAMFAALMGALLLLPQLLIAFKPLGPEASTEAVKA
jgi:predicted RND superfamily exporter protein